MKPAVRLLILFLFLLQGEVVFCQKVNAEIFIPIDNRNEIWLKPRVDTIDNKHDYEFRIRVSPEFKISQFLFEKGLAVQNDSTLVITANSTSYGGFDTATLRVIVKSLTGSRTLLFQKQFIIRVPPRMFPVITNPQVNLVKLNDKIFLERNKPYAKDLFTKTQPWVTMYDNQVTMSKMEVKGVTIALYEKEGKNYVSKGDTISSEAIREIKKIKDPTPLFIKVDAMKGKSKKSVWNRIIIYND